VGEGEEVGCDGYRLGACAEAFGLGNEWHVDTRRTAAGRGEQRQIRLMHDIDEQRLDIGGAGSTFYAFAGIHASY
jgi:hypothetical protein